MIERHRSKSFCRSTNYYLAYVRKYHFEKISTATNTHTHSIMSHPHDWRLLIHADSSLLSRLVNCWFCTLPPTTARRRQTVAGLKKKFIFTKKKHYKTYPENKKNNSLEIYLSQHRKSTTTKSTIIYRMKKFDTVKFKEKQIYTAFFCQITWSGGGCCVGEQHGLPRRGAARGGARLVNGLHSACSGRDCSNLELIIVEQMSDGKLELPTQLGKEKSQKKLWLILRETLIFRVISSRL